MPLVLQSALHFVEKNRAKLLAAILCLAALLRIEGVGHGVSFHPDERAIVMAVERLSPSDLNPRFFAYGSLTFYLVWIVSSALSIFSKWYASYDGIFYVGRSVCLVIALGALPLTYALARRLSGSAVAGLLSALLLALNPLHLQLSKFYTSDIILTTIATALLVTLLQACRDSRAFWWLIGAALFGLGMATKVAGLFLVAPIGAAVLIKVLSDHKGLSWRSVSVLGGVGVAAAAAAGVVVLPLVLSGELRVLFATLSEGESGFLRVVFPAATLPTALIVLLVAFCGVIVPFCRLWWQFGGVFLCAVLLAGWAASGLGIAIAIPSLLLSTATYWMGRHLKADPLIAAIFQSVCLAVFTFLLVSPYTLLDWSTFLSQVQEQTRMASGQWRPPYTIQYEHTAPWLYQFAQAFLYTVGPETLLVCLVGLLLSFVAAFNRKHAEFWILLAWIVPTFLYTAALQVKYPRYLLPLYPSLCVVGGYTLFVLLEFRNFARLFEAPLAWFKDSRNALVLPVAAQSSPLQTRLLYGVLIVGAVGLFYRLVDFPIYFFCDEAVHSVEARTLLTTFRDSDGRFLPLFVRGFGDFQLGLSVYIHVLFEAIFGFTIGGVRATTATVSLLALWWISRISTEHLGIKNSWVAPLLLLGSATWFLHARAGFENVLSVTFFLGFLLYYLRGLCGSAKAFAISGFLAGLCCYSYTGGRAWVVFTFAALLLGNVRFHLLRWKETLWLIGGFLFCLLPFIRFTLVDTHLAAVRLEKVWDQRGVEVLLRNFVGNYPQVLSPSFWFSWEGALKGGPEERHVVAGMAPIGSWLLPVAALGAVLMSLRAWFDHRSRAILLATLAIPVTASLFGLTIPRILALLPMFVLFSARGLDALLEMCATRISPNIRLWMRAAVCVQLVGLFGHLTYYSLYQAPARYSDYGFYGLQYGAPQVFAITKKFSGFIEERTKTAPRVYLSHALFNGNDIYPAFFMEKSEAARVAIIENRRLCEKVKVGEEFVFAYRSEFGDEVKGLTCLITEREEVVLSPQGRPLFNVRIGRGSPPAIAESPGVS